MEQRVIKGGFFQEISSLTGGIKPHKILFVTGRHLLRNAQFQSLLKPNSAFLICHPPEGLLQINSIPVFHGIEVIVAVGGGKVIDFAKGILHQSAENVSSIAAPTTAGTGSEATPFAVFYNGLEKVSLDHPSLLPQFVILDVDLVRDLPPEQKAISGADAFAQCIESIWNLQRSDASEGFALEGLKILHQQLPAFVHSGDDELASEMLSAAHLSGKAIASTRTTGPHALSYYLTAQHSIPHGQAVALFLPLFFLYNKNSGGERQLQKIYGMLGVGNAEEAYETCRRFFSSIGLATTFAEAGLKNVDVDSLLDSVNRQRFANNPVPFDAAVLNGLIRRYLC